MNKKLLLLLAVSSIFTTQTFANSTWDVKILPYDPYEITQQRYIYTWSLPTNFTWLTIYKWINNLVEDEKLKNMLWSLQLEEFDLSKLDNITLTNLSIKEKKEKWFRINLDFEWWYISVYRDYNSNYQLNQAPKNIERLSNEQALEIAQEFIIKYKINVSKYWEPYVENSSMIMYKSASNDFTDPYVQVVYPTKIDWKNVNERYWQNAWLRISVSSETKSIEWFSVKIEKLEKTNDASYINDKSRLENIILKGWNDYNFVYESGYTIKYQDIKLVNPKIEYVKVDTYVNWINTYYSPAIVFETIKSDDQNMYIQDKIIVPLIDKAYETY